MKKILFLFILVLIIKPGFSQFEIIDFEELLIQVDSISSVSNDMADSLAEVGYNKALELNNIEYQVEFLIKQAYYKNLKFEGQRAISLLFQALELCENNNLDSHEIKVLLEIAMKHCYIEEFKEAEKLIIHVISKLNNNVDTCEIANAYAYAGEIFSWSAVMTLSQLERTLRYDTVRNYFFKSLDYIPDTNSSQYAWAIAGLAASFQLADTILTKTQYLQQLKLFEEAISIFKNNENRNAELSTIVRLCNAHLRMRKFDEALQLAKKAEKIALELNDQFQLQQIYYIIYDASRKLENYENALNYRLKYTNIKFENLKVEKISTIDEIREKYETEQKEATINQQKQELKLNKATLKYQRRILIVSVLASLILIVASIVFYRLYKKNKMISKKNVLLVKEQNHRVKNNLQIISALLSLQANRVEHTGAKQAIEDSKLRVEAIGMIQKRLYGENTVEVNVNEFVKELVDSIISLYDYEQSQIKINLDIDPIWMRVEKTVPLGLILNELLTNSCKYAFDKNPTPKLNISLREENNQIRFSYFDNGSGFNPEEVNKQKSFGIKLIDLQSYQLDAQPVWEKNGGMEFRMVFES